MFAMINRREPPTFNTQIVHTKILYILNINFNLGISSANIGHTLNQALNKIFIQGPCPKQNYISGDIFFSKLSFLCSKP